MSDSSEPCPQCHGTSWTLSGGVLVCDVCGTQSQVFLQEAQEFQTGIDDLRYRRRAAGGSQKNAAPLASDSTPPDTKTIHVILSVYSKALQHTLQGIVQSLQELCGSDAMTTSAIHRIWMAVLQNSDMLSMDFARSVKQSMDEVLPIQRAWRIVLKGAAWKALHPDLLLVVVYLGCWSTRQAVCATDVLRWANDGALPFLSLRGLSNPVLEKANASSLRFPASLLQPTGVMGIQELMSLSAQTASQIHLRLPPVNAPALIVRFGQELHIPQEVARVALQMFEVHLAGTPQMRLQDDIHMHPYSHLMAIMIVAIKLVYGLDAEDAQASHSSTHQALEWQSWADAVVGSSRGPTTFPKTALEASMLNAKEWDSYLRFLRSIALAQTEAGRGLQHITEAARKAWGAFQSEALQAVPNAAPMAELPPLPPRVYGEVARTPHYRLTSIKDSAKLHSMGPDYAAVVTACAAHLWLQPLYLHKAVLKLETAMTALESTAANEAAGTAVDKA
ncbi:g3386 [Coccomyxa viridis]|uniref:G3386 protein n=1 Tax=Coccomyxa viridis TaxID=1274662 RepID=A0ABP1FPZ8_9CHLO